MRTSIVVFLLAASVACNQPDKQAENSTAAQPQVVVDPSTAATVSGTVAFEGTPPKPQAIDSSVDPACANGLTGEQISVREGKLANVLVYVKEGINGVTPAPEEAAVIDQDGCRYKPHVLGVVAGQPVKFTNSDPTTHNVHPRPEINRKWNQSQQPGDGPTTKSFPTPELMIPVKCNVHPWMRMWLHVLPHRFFAITGEDGSFSIPGLPPGTYTVAVLHETLGEQTLPLTVGPKESKQVSFRYK